MKSVITMEKHYSNFHSTKFVFSNRAILELDFTRQKFDLYKMKLEFNVLECEWNLGFSGNEMALWLSHEW
jgi:hypothetical protein